MSPEAAQRETIAGLRAEVAALRKAIAFTAATLAADFGGWWASAQADTPLGKVRDRLSAALTWKETP